MIKRYIISIIKRTVQTFINVPIGFVEIMLNFTMNIVGLQRGNYQLKFTYNLFDIIIHVQSDHDNFTLSPY